MYELIIESPTSGYIVNKSTKRILCCVETKRPDLEFKELRRLIFKANEWDKDTMLKDDDYYEQELIDVFDTMHK